MARHTIEGMAELVLLGGPSRVIVSGTGEATTNQQARDRYNVVPDIVFLRGDGWTLGAPKQFETVAYAMWRNEWVGFMRRGDKVATPIARYAHA